MARGHRCSLRHNVCRRATAVFANVCNGKTFQRGEYLAVEFLIRYFIYTTLLLIIHILCTQKWAAQCDAPLRSGRRTMMGEIIYYK